MNLVSALYSVLLALALATLQGCTGKAPTADLKLPGSVCSSLSLTFYRAVEATQQTYMASPAALATMDLARQFRCGWAKAAKPLPSGYIWHEPPQVSL